MNGRWRSQRMELCHWQLNPPMSLASLIPYGSLWVLSCGRVVTSHQGWYWHDYCHVLIDWVILVPGLNLGWGLSVQSLNVFPVSAWVLSNPFSTVQKHAHKRLIGDSKLNVNGSLSLGALRWAGDLSRVSLAGSSPTAIRMRISGYR